MEKKITVSASSDACLIDLAQELQAVGLGKYADSYYMDEAYDVPYFKVVKPFASETPNDPQEEIIFVDAGDEYTVHSRLGHDHFGTAKEAAIVVRGLYDGAIVEVALCLPTVTARFLTANSGDPEQNVDKIAHASQAVMDILSSCDSLPVNTHMHRYFAAAAPFYLQIIPEENTMWNDCVAYFQSVTFGYHAEIYIVEG